MVGEYQWLGTYGIRSTLEIKADNSFEYYWQVGLVWGKTFGTWKIEGRKIILNSERQQEIETAVSYEVIRKISNLADSISIKIECQDNRPLPFACCVFKTDTITLIKTFTNLQGEAKLPILEADSLIVTYPGYKTILHQIDNSITCYEFKMKDCNTYKYFTNEIWIYRKDKLYSSKINSSKYFNKSFFERIK